MIVGLEEATPDQLPEDLAGQSRTSLRLYMKPRRMRFRKTTSLFIGQCWLWRDLCGICFGKRRTYCHIGGTMDGNTFSYLKNSYTIPTPQSIFY